MRVEVLRAVFVTSSTFWDATQYEYFPVKSTDVSQERTASIDEYESLPFDSEDGSNSTLKTSMNSTELYSVIFQKTVLFS
jgi:hypothetical protein